MQKVKATIHLGNIRRNAQAFKSLTGVSLCAVVKANAYGHGAEETAFALSGVADCFAVALVEEGLSIRQAVCGKKILVLTPPMTEEEVYTMAINGFIVSVSSMDTAKKVLAVCKKFCLSICVHLKINTGMNRYGLLVSETERVCALFKNESLIQVTGVYSHLYDTTLATAAAQRERFLQAVDVCKRHFPKTVAHLSATYGCFLGKDFAFDMVRVGLGLYGYLPQGLVGRMLEVGRRLALKRAMQVSAAVIEGRNATFGGAGYGEPLQSVPAQLYTLRVGYADGFLRRRENGLSDVSCQPRPACMDASVRIGLLPQDRWQTVMWDADEIARRTGTISYEVLCAATRRAEFIYDND